MNGVVDILSEAAELSSDFFDADNKLKASVRAVLLKVVEDVLASLDDKGFMLTPASVVLTGSLCGASWDEQSDVDLHIGVNFGEYSEPSLAKQFLAYFARSFNREDFDLLKHPIELYFQDANEEHDAPGVYDIENDSWLKVPEDVKIEITDDVEAAAAQYKEKAEKLTKAYEVLPKEYVGNFLKELQAYWDSIRAVRKEGLAASGRASFGNQLFKRLRRNGTLGILRALMHQVKDDVYEVY